MSKPMTPDEAAVELETDARQFVAFRDSTNEQ